MNFAILGCGPAGLLAAHACARAGVDFNIYSLKRKSPIHGAQFLHIPIPGIHHENSPDGHVVMVKDGTREGYARKVYGNPDAPVSWDHYDEGLRPAWSMSRTYDFLWERYQDKVQHLSLGYDIVQEMLHGEQVISAVPAPAICGNKAHSFHQTTIWFRDEHPDGVALEENTIVYNGDPVTPWYRASSLFGTNSVEYGHRVQRATRGMKPLGTDCNCHHNSADPYTFTRVGRFGRWERGILAHDGFVRTETILDGNQ